VLDQGLVALVNDDDGLFIGLITRIDFINFIRYEQQK